MATSTIETRKCSITRRGDRSNSTTRPPSTIWASTPPTNPSDSQVRSRRRGTRASDPRTATITATDTTPVIVRLTNSIIAGASVISDGVSRPSSQLGQSVHPRPDPVSRTAAPVTTITANARSANSVIRRYAAGETRGRATAGRA